MKLTKMRFDRLMPVDGYGPGFFRIGGKVHEGGVLLSAQGAQSWNGPQESAMLEALGGQVDILILGMGASLSHPPGDLITRLEAAGIGVEFMASPAACRTYNVLAAEGRRIALAALPV